jgi:hypothetical protein
MSITDGMLVMGSQDHTFGGHDPDRTTHIFTREQMRDWAQGLIRGDSETPIAVCGKEMEESCTWMGITAVREHMCVNCMDIANETIKQRIPIQFIGGQKRGKSKNKLE